MQLVVTYDNEDGLIYFDRIKIGVKAQITFDETLALDGHNGRLKRPPWLFDHFVVHDAKSSWIQMKHVDRLRMIAPLPAK